MVTQICQVLTRSVELNNGVLPAVDNLVEVGWVCGTGARTITEHLEVVRRQPIRLQLHAARA